MPGFVLGKVIKKRPAQPSGAQDGVPAGRYCLRQTQGRGDVVNDPFSGPMRSREGHCSSSDHHYAPLPRQRTVWKITRTAEWAIGSRSVGGDLAHPRGGGGKSLGSIPYRGRH